MADFDGRVALITGASGNLGAAVARAFAARGARLALVERRPEKLERAFPEWAASPDHLFGRADLTDAEAVAAIAQAAVERFGRIDILVNTAGGYRAGAPAHQTPAEDWDFLLDLNLRTAVNASRAVVPHMLRRGEGKIVHTAARAALAGRANMAAYVISKSTIIRLTESMAAELKEGGINVNCVLPGRIDTPANRQETPEADFSKWVRPEALAEVIVFLASPAAAAVHGAAVPVYGLS